MNTTVLAAGLSIGSLVGIFASLELGYRLGRRRSEQGADDHTGALEAAVFGLLGLLLAFSFSAGSTHLDSRRQMVVDEANNIGTAYLRLDLLPAADQAELRQMFREYLDTRLRVLEKLPNLEAANQEMERAESIQQKIWSKAASASQASATPTAALLLLPALNQMIDITTTRRVALYTHLPELILVMLLIVTLLSGLLAGFAMSKRGSRSWLHMAVYSIVVAVTIYAVIDLDYPRWGLIRLDAADEALARLRDSIR